MITTDEHAQIALRFLDVSDEEFAEGKRMQASEKLWGAASQSVIAVAQQRGWDDSSHKGLKDAVRQLTQEHDDPTIRLGSSLLRSSMQTSITVLWTTSNWKTTALWCANS